MGNVQSLSPTATRAGWVMPARGPAGTGRGILQSVIEACGASRSRRPRDPVTGAVSGWLTGLVTGREAEMGPVAAATARAWGVCCSAGLAERSAGSTRPGRGDAAAEPGGVGQVEPAGGDGGAELREEPGG